MKRLGSLRAAAIMTALVGAGGSIGCTLRVGRRNHSLPLMSLFAVWVLSPFVALVFAGVVSKRWPARARATLYGVTAVVVLGSLAIYGDVAFGPPRAKPAFFFLAVPLASWLAMAVAGAIAARVR